jgi:hypothetical protein
MDIDAEPKEDPLVQRKDTIKHTIIEIQANWDDKGVTTELQKYMFNQIFGGLEASTNPADLDLSHEHRLGALIREIPTGWKGDLDSIVPNSFKKLIKLQKKWDLMEPRRYLMCLGTEDCAHEPLIFGPIDKDKYEDRKVVQCSCDPP